MKYRFSPDDLPLDRRAVNLLMFATGVALAPHLPYLPVFIPLFCLVFGMWRWMSAHYAWALPGLAARTVLTLTALTGVYLGFGTVLGRDAGTGLLVIMLGLKLLETRCYRDAVVVLFLDYFLCVTAVLYSQAIPILVYLTLALLVITAAMIGLNQPARGHAPLRTMLRRAGILLLQAIPLAVLLFVLFPRISGPLWGLPQDGQGDMNGLDDSMTPGSITHLSRSDRVAFRVDFKGALPPAQLLYWRGPVLWHTDGRSWSSSRDKGVATPAATLGFTPLDDETLEYTVTLEPHNRSWLYALDLPLTVPAQARRTADLFLVADKPVRQLTRYTATSATYYRTDDLSAAERARALQLPTANPATRALGAQWRRQAANDVSVLELALSYFAEEPFFYTLEPPPLGSDSVDEFLFNTRRGFCEHYSAAFTVLMRAAGIPARVVTGYQGGELNPLGDYLIVRQRDAHAWSEVWLAGQGWVRVDPTAAVAPQRIEQGIDSVLPAPQRGLLRDFGAGPFGALWQHSRLAWDTLNNRWNQWVLAYGPENQAALLSRFGLRSWTDMVLTSLAGSLLLLATLGSVLLIRRRCRLDPALRLYLRYCRKLARRGIVRAPSEGPAAFAARVQHQRPELREAVALINCLYIAIRYGSLYSADQINQLRRAVAAFRP
jgi:transglutaminase-like putative cysteine protease